MLHQVSEDKFIKQKQLWRYAYTCAAIFFLVSNAAIFNKKNALELKNRKIEESMNEGNYIQGFHLF